MDVNHAKEVDYCGLVSGRDVIKFAETKLTEEVGCTGVPLIKESPLSIECEMDDLWVHGSHHVFVGRVRSARIRETDADWLMHNIYDYFGREGRIGTVFGIGHDIP